MSESQEPLSWLAFRYAANELSAAEAREFESQLMTDQSAREAVADAVAETVRIRQALGGTVVVAAASQRANWKRMPARVVVVVFGSCLTLFVALCLVRSSQPISNDLPQHAAFNSLGSPAELAFAWVEARNDSVELRPELIANLAQADTVDLLLNASNDSPAEPSLVAPSWMLAALARMDGAIGSEFEIQE